MSLTLGRRGIKHKKAYRRLDVYDFDFLFRLMEGKEEVFIKGVKVKLTSQRYAVWKQKGIKCVSCGITAKYIALECHIKNLQSNVYHFNAYCVQPNGNEVMLTKDHIIPKPKGGKNTLKNYQPMCAHCNTKKGATMPTKELPMTIEEFVYVKCKVVGRSELAYSGRKILDVVMVGDGHPEQGGEIKFSVFEDETK